MQEVELAQVGIALVAAGVGIHFAFASLEAIHLPSVVFKPLKDAPQLEMALAWRKDNRSLALQQLLEGI